MGRRFMFACSMALGLAASGPLPSDTIVLKNGKEMNGVVRDDGGPRILIKTDQMDVWIRRDQVAEIRIESPPDIFVRQGDQKLAQGDLVGARAAYRQALDMDPENEKARQALQKIDAMGQEERAAADKGARQAQALSLLRQARDMLDKALLDEANEILAQAAQLAPDNPDVLLGAAKAALTGWSVGKLPQTTFGQYLAQLEKADPNNKEIPILKQQKATLAEQRKLSLPADRESLFQEIMRAHQAKVYDGRLLNKIELLLEMQPDEESKAKVLEAQAAAQQALAGKAASPASSPAQSQPAEPQAPASSAPAQTQPLASKPASGAAAQSQPAGPKPASGVSALKQLLPTLKPSAKTPSGLPARALPTMPPRAAKTPAPTPKKGVDQKTSSYYDVSPFLGKK